MYSIILILICYAAHIAAYCNPARLGFNRELSEFLVRGIDKSQLDMAVIVPATRENIWPALIETLDLSYKAILRCTGASAGSTDEQQLEISTRTQFFVAKGQALVYSTLQDWEDDYDFDRWPLGELLFHPEPDRDPFLTVEAYMSWVMIWHIPSHELANFLPKISDDAKIFINDDTMFDPFPDL